MSIVVQTENFSGPLALLLYLIRREEMDIFDINVHQITRQYMDYIRAMKKLDLELAGDFIAMAATLIQIKSRMLLPQYDEEGEEIEGHDPRKELVQKLLEYQKFQEASQQLYDRPLLGRDLWLRGRRVQLDSPEEEAIITEDNALFSLIRSYRTAVKSMKNAVHKVSGEMQSISERIMELKRWLYVGARTTFFKLMPEQRHVNHVLVTFLSLLELTRMGFISVFQSENFADIHIDVKKEIDGDVVSKAESFEAADTQALAEEIRAVNEVEIPEDLDYEDEPEGLHGREVESGNVDEKLNAQFDLFDEDEQDEINPLVEAATDEEIFAEEQRIAEQDLQNRSSEEPQA